MGMKSWLFVAGVLSALSPALRGGEVIRFNGTRINDVTILSASLDEVRYKIRGFKPTQRLAAWEVESVAYASDGILERVAALVDQSEWNAALEALEESRRSALMEEPAAYWRACIAYRRFIETGEGGKETIRALADFVTQYKARKGFHVPEALFLHGKALLAMGDREGARARFSELAALSGATRALLGRLGYAQIALAEGKARAAVKDLEFVASEAKSMHAATIQRRAMVWYGRALVADGRASEAIERLREYVESATSSSPSRDRLLARANNALADAYAASDNPDDRMQALISYLKTTCFYKQWRFECAEAFHKAEAVARAQGLEKDAEDMARRLATQFGDTRWARTGM